MRSTLQRRLALLLAVLGAGGAVLGVAGPANADESQIAVIASNQAPRLAIDGNLLRDIYLKKIYLTPDRRPYIPVNLPPIDKLRIAFSSAVVHMNLPQLQAYWDRQYFQGISPPFILASQAAVVKFVAATPGAIGYVQACYLGPSVHVILMLTLSEAALAGTLEKCPDHAAQ